MLALLVAFAASSPAPAQTPDGANILLNQKGMDIDQLIALVSRETRRTILFDEQVGGRISLVSKRAVTKEEAWQLLDAALHLLGFAIVPSTADQWRITRLAEVTGEAPFTRRVREDSDRSVTALIPLEAAPIQSVMNVIQPLAGATVTLVALESNHSIIASGPEAAIARLMELADELDRVEERALRQRVLRYRQVADVDAMIQAQFDAGYLADRELEIWTDERTNSLLFRGSDEAVAKLRDFLERIDRPNEGAGEIQILRVLNRDADDLAQILGGTPSSSGGSRSSRERAERERSGETPGGGVGAGGATGAGTGGTQSGTSGSSSTGSSTRSSRSQQTASRSDSRSNVPVAAPGDGLLAQMQGTLPGTPGTQGATGQPGTPGAGGAVDAAGAANDPSSSGSAYAPIDLKSLLGGEDYSIAVDGPTRSLVVRASPHGHRIIRELVEELDQRPQLISVELTVSELLVDDQLALALSYHLPLTAGDSLDEVVGRIVNQPVAGRAFATTPIAPSALFGRVSQDAGVNFQLPDGSGTVIPIANSGVIDANRAKVLVDVLIQPSLVIVAGEKHELFVGNNFPVPTSQAGNINATPSPTNPAVGLFGVTVNFNRQDVGIRLTIEAKAGKEGPVTLDLDTEISDLAPSSVGDITKVGPTLIKQTLTARARLDDGETAIVGVDRQKKETATVAGPPFLSDIPFLGWLFKGRARQTVDNYIVIAARARRIATPAELVADSIRRRLVFDRERARDLALPDGEGAPYGVRVTTRSLEDDARAIAADLERQGHRTRIKRWQSADRRTLFDVYVLGFDSLVDAGALAHRLAEDGWDADLVVFSSRSSSTRS